MITCFYRGGGNSLGEVDTDVPPRPMGYLRDASPVYRYHILFLNTSARRIGMIWRPSLHFCNLHNDRFEDLPINYCSQWRSVASMSIISRTSHFSEQNTTKTLKNEKFKNVLPGVWYTNSKMCNFCPAFGSCFHCYFVCPGFGRNVTGAHLYPPAQGSCPPPRSICITMYIFWLISSSWTQIYYSRSKKIISSPRKSRY